jgi:hypothetical protein
MRAKRLAWVIPALAVLVASDVFAGECPQCGCCRTRKRCRVECFTEEVKHVEYDCRSEDFCLPGPSRCCGVRHVCDDCGKRRREIVWQPGSARLRTRTVLVKREVVEETPTWRWVVERICCECGEIVSTASAPADVPGVVASISNAGG